MIYQIETTATVQEDSGEVVSVNYWVEHQGSRTSMPDTSRMIPAIESDRAGRPWVEFGGDVLYRIYVSECAFALPLWYVGGVNHVHCFDLRWKFFLSSCVQLAGFVIVFALRWLTLVFGVELAGLLEDPTFSVGVISWLIGGAIKLARPV